jgi:hypothetical protein
VFLPKRFYEIIYKNYFANYNCDEEHIELIKHNKFSIIFKQHVKGKYLVYVITNRFYLGFNSFKKKYPFDLHSFYLLKSHKCKPFSKQFIYLYFNYYFDKMINFPDNVNKNLSFFKENKKL